MTSPREMPHSLETEKHILASILLAPEGEPAGRFLAMLAAVCAPPLHRWFFDRNHRLLTIALDSALRGERGADGAAIADTLRYMEIGDAAEYIGGRSARWALRKDLAAVDSVLTAIGGYNAVSDWQGTLGTRSAETFAANVRRLRAFAEARTGIELLRATAGKLYNVDAQTGPGPALGQLAAELGALAGGGLADRDVGAHLVDALAEHDRQAAARDDGRAAEATWGVPALDVLCRLAPGGLYVLASPPGIGKTSLAWQAAASTACSGTRPGAVGFISLEMTGGDLAAILAGRVLGIAPAAIREGALHPERRQQVEELAASWRSVGNLWVRDTSGGRFTVDELCAWARHRQAVAGGKLALLVVDYLQLIDGTDSKQSEYARLSEQTRRLKRLALDLRIPLLVLSQLSREGRKPGRDRTTGANMGSPEPRLEDLRGSGSIEQDADAVIFLHVARDDGSSPLPVEAIVAKNRRGPKGQTFLAFNRRRQEFTAAEAPASTSHTMPEAIDDSREDMWHDLGGRP